MSFCKMWLIFLFCYVTLVHLISCEEYERAREDTISQDLLTLTYYDKEYYNDDEDDEECPKNKVANSNIMFQLYTQSSRQSDSIAGNYAEGITLTDFSDNRKSIFLIHGWKNNNESDFNVILAKAILEVYDVNLFQVDWRIIAKESYSRAQKCVRGVGKYIGQFIDYLLEEYNTHPSDFILIGHSLGAHVAGYAGAYVSGVRDEYVDSIIALDPAGPRFAVSEAEIRTNILQADFVHVIHTNAGFLGIPFAVGNADYYPNGGIYQPGCSFDLLGKCAHSMAYIYLAESISKSEFVARKCFNYETYEDMLCNKNRPSRMGGLFVDKSASGVYFLTTNEKPPYAKQENFTSD